MHFVHGAADHFVARNVFVRAEDVFRFVVSVDVGGNEIDGDILFFAVRQEAVGPGGLRCGWSADAETRAACLMARAV